MTCKKCTFTWHSDPPPHLRPNPWPPFFRATITLQSQATRWGQDQQAQRISGKISSFAFKRARQAEEAVAITEWLHAWTCASLPCRCRRTSITVSRYRRNIHEMGYQISLAYISYNACSAPSPSLLTGGSRTTPGFVFRKRPPHNYPRLLGE